jgi:hypothetical protein
MMVDTTGSAQILRLMLMLPSPEIRQPAPGTEAGACCLATTY